MGIKENKASKPTVKDRMQSAKLCKDPDKLKKFIKDRSWKVREVAALNKFATSDMLLSALDDKHWTVRRNAACHGKATPLILLKALDDENGHVRMQAAHGNKATFEVMFKAIESEEENIRKHTVKATFGNSMIRMVSWKLLSKLKQLPAFSYLNDRELSLWVDSFVDDPLFRLSIKTKITDMGLMGT